MKNGGKRRGGGKKGGPSGKGKSKRGKTRGARFGGPSPSNPLKMQRRLREAAPARATIPKAQRDTGRWIYGHHVVEESLGGLVRVHMVCIDQGHKAVYRDIAERAKRLGASVRWVASGELGRLCGSGAHQGLAAKITEREGKTLDAFVQSLSAEQMKSTVLVALDQIQDPHNFGAIARSANCFGASGILTTEFRSATISQTVLQTSAGAIQKIPSFRVTNLGQTLVKLKEAGFWVYGADASGTPSWKVKFNRPMVLVIGAEGKGIRPLVKTYCNELVRIWQDERGVASLNASCAASVLLYEAARQFKR